MAHSQDPMNAGPPDQEGRTDVPRKDVSKVRLGGRGWRFTPRRMLFGCCKLAGVVMVLAVVCAGILALRLQQGPMEIDGLGEKIASALHDRFGNGLAFDLGRASMVQRGFGPTLAIDKLTVAGADNQTILSAPKAEVSIDPFALVFGRVAPKRLEVMDVTLRLVLLKNGSLAIAAGGGTKPFLELGRTGDPAPDAAKPVTPVPTSPESQSSVSQSAQPAAPTHRAIVMKQASAAIRQFLDILTAPHSALAAVDRLGITRGKLVIDDQLNDEEVVYSDLALAFDKAHGVTNLTLSATGPNGRWTVAAKAEGVPGGDRRFGLKAENLTIDEAQLIAGTRSLGVDTDMRIAFSADIGLTPANTLSEAGGHIKLGPGFLRTSDPDQEPIFITEIDSSLHWNGTERRIEVAPSRYIEGDTGLYFKGAIDPPHNEGDPWRVNLGTTKPCTLAPDRKNQPKFIVDAGQLKGRLFLDRKTFLFDRLAFHGKDGGIALAGAFDWVKGPHVKLGARIDPTSVSFVQRVWPGSMASSVRAYILNHFTTGEVTSGTIKIDYDENALKRLRADRAPPDQSVVLDFTLSKGSLRYLDGVPPIENVEGVGHITGRSSRFSFTSGTIDAGGRKIAVSDGAFLVPNTDQHPMPATLTAHLKGSVEAVTDILSRDALKPYASLPLDGSTLHGEIDGTLEKSMLLGHNTGNANAPLKVSAKVSDFSAEHLVGKESLEDANLEISVDEHKMKASGQGRIFGGPSTFQVERAGEGPPNAQIVVTLDDAARTRLGLPTIPGISGPMTAHVNANLGDPSKLKAQVDLDLAKTSIAVAYLGVNKAAGRPAKVSFALEPRDGRLSIEQLVIDVASLQARGSVELGEDNGFRSARFSSFKVSPGDDMRLEVAKGNDTFKLTIRGSTIDGRPFLKALTSTPTNGSTPMARSAQAEKKEAESFKGFDVDLKAGILTGFNKEVMNAVDLKLSKRGSQYRQFAVHGRFGSDAVSGSMGTNQRLKISAQDAGSLLSFINLYKHMENGSLTANMQVGDDSLDGNLEIHDFVLRDEPALRSLVATSATVSSPGDRQAAQKINAGAAGFKRLKVNFERAGSRLELHDATMSGNEIGLSVDGWLDYVHNQVAIDGTFVPVFALNNMFAQIPVFGVFLGGRSDQGLFAMTFRISGLVTQPTLSINPLSVVAPGFLRTIFGAIEPGGIPLPGAVDQDDSPSR